MADIKGIELASDVYGLEDEKARDDVETNTSAIGTLADLETTAKTDLVTAINEVNGDVQDIVSLVPSGTTTVNPLVNEEKVAPALANVYLPNLKDSVTAESGVSVEDLRFVQKGKVCLLTTDMIMLTERKNQGAILFKLPSTIPAPKVGVYTMMFDIGHNGFVPVYISTSRQVSLLFSTQSFPTIAGSIEYLTE